MARTKHNHKGAYFMKVSSDVNSKSKNVARSEPNLSKSGKFYIELISLLLIGLVQQPIGKLSKGNWLFRKRAIPKNHFYGIYILDGAHC